VPQLRPARAAGDAEAFLESLPAELAARVRPLCGQAKIRLLRDESKLRLARLVTRAAQAVAQARCTSAAAVLFVDWIEPLLRRESYLALLAERPEVQNRLLRLLGLARWPMRYLMLHPGVIDELGGRTPDAQPLRRRGLPARARGAPRRLDASSQAEEELLLDTCAGPPCRGLPHAGARRRGHITVEEVADDMSALADATLSCALRWAWRT
jgi:glutamate-ammonia-ligase adenylyltransferase